MDALLAVTDDFAWLSAPSLVPWMGAVAVIVAAFAVSARAWVKSPWWLLPRVVVAVGVWFAVVLLLAWLFPPPQPEAPVQAQPVPAPVEQTVVVTMGQAPTGIPANTAFVIQFVPTEGDAKVARDFACDLLLLGGKAPEEVKIRARGMDEFEKLLVQHLRRATVPQDASQASAIILRTPFPGEGVLRRARQKVESVYPGIAVTLDGGPS